jgi:glycogen phosphorylase
MNERTNSSHLEYHMLPTDLEGGDALIELALNLSWSWNHRADKIWQRLDAALWDQTHNPWVVLKTISRDKLKEALTDPNFRKQVDELVKANQLKQTTPGWFQNSYPNSNLKTIAYFSMEFMLTEALPIYSGGLGNVAGDQLKSASDLGVPVVAVGLLYQQGYFRQAIDKDGAQQALYPYNDPGQLPISPLRKANGEWLRIKIEFPGWTLWLRTWQAQVGRTRLLLLDSNYLANPAIHRGITSELYGGGSELRLKQELLLGIVGWMLLEELGIKPEVCHLNEGHAAFAILERARCYMQETGVPFHEALEIIRAGNLFTTHTAVPAGFDRFSPDLIDQYLGKYAKNKLGISLQDLLALGRMNPTDANEPFNMAYLAFRGSGAVNGVSRLHGKVSRQIFQSLFPHWPENDVPVGYVTNGVHMPSWDSTGSDELWTDTCGKERWLGTCEKLGQGIRSVPDVKIWQMRATQRKDLIQYVRERFSRERAASGSPIEEVTRAKNLFDSNTLTLGFARRFATYKRPNMLLHDPERLIRILTNPQRPVQLIVAGKAHPADTPGKNLILEWTHFLRRPEVQGHVVFLSDYDMLLTEHLVSGVDVWINTPRRPWEACGTSGMKVLVNGGLNISELDGWWAEAYAPEIGWALGDGKEHGDDPAWDAVEAETLYDLLEREVVPQFYTRNAEGVPTEWVARIRESMARLTPIYAANRTVREYTEKYYLPAAQRYLDRTVDQGFKGKQLVDWKKHIQEHWHKLRFVGVKYVTSGDQHDFEALVYLDDMDPNAVKIELFADQIDDQGSFEQAMKCIRHLESDPCTFIYQASVPASRSADSYTARITPDFPNVSIPLEANQILWER